MRRNSLIEHRDDRLEDLHAGNDLHNPVGVALIEAEEWTRRIDKASGFQTSLDVLLQSAQNLFEINIEDAV